MINIYSPDEVLRCLFSPDPLVIHPESKKLVEATILPNFNASALNTQYPLILQFDTSGKDMRKPVKIKPKAKTKAKAKARSLTATGKFLEPGFGTHFGTRETGGSMVCKI